MIPGAEEILKGSSNENPLQKEKKEDFDSERLYTPDQKEYLSYLQGRLQRAKDQKNQPYEEFDGKNYYQDYDENVKIANTRLPEKKNDDDVIVSAGTVESKLDALLAHVQNLDLGPEVLAFDKENNRINELGVALSDTIFFTEQRDGGEIAGDKEKKLLRQRELLSQNAVFVQEEWLRTFERKKKLQEKYNGEFKNWKKWDESLELVFEGPARTQLHGPNVFLGDITEYFMEKQPYFFIVIQQHYDIAKTKYGKFENWKYVKKGRITDSIAEEQKTIYDNKWRLTEVKDEQVEIILYQDKPNDEFQIIINGVCMLPIGFPLSAVAPGGEYNVVKQVFRPISAKFAYGKPFVRLGSVREISKLIDEMLKLFVLKTRKSYAPPYINTSGKVISRRVLSAGRISMGIPPDALQKIGDEGQGVTANEYNILKELQDRVDKSTVSNQFAGQQGKAGTTATEVVELQRQARLTLGLTIAACEFLELKLAYLRLWNILENWYEPMDTKVITINDVRKYVNTYRNVTRETNIEGEGLGERQILPTDESPVPSPEVIREMERAEENRRGIPVRKVFLNPAGLKVAKIRWYVVITPREKETSAFFKLLFREQLSDILTMMQLGSMPNIDGLEEQYSKVWNVSRTKLFKKGTPDMAGVSSALGQTIQGRTNQAGVPGGSVPSAIAAE
jgi:hypothetical protein